MKITILAVGKAKTAQLETAIAEYVKRLSRWVAVEWDFVPTSDVLTESKALLRRIPMESYVILLDERGNKRSTLQLAAQLEQLKNQSTKRLVFVIGGAHGVDTELALQAEDVWSLSPLIFPHELVRLILVEQLYRAHDINAGGSYHHA